MTLEREKGAVEQFFHDELLVVLCLAVFAGFHPVGDRFDLVAAFSFNGVGVAAATTGLVQPIFAMIAMVLSVSAVLANGFAGGVVSGEDVNTAFAVEEGTASGA